MMKVEIRADRSEMIVRGYVNVTGRNSRCLQNAQGPFVEQIMPGAFGQALQRGDIIGLKFNHRRDLGSTSDGSLELREDNIGLYADSVVRDKEVIAEAEAGKLRGWSFAFVPLKQSWEDGNPRRRCIEEMELREVSILTKTPAYIATSIETRDTEDVLIEYRSEDGDLDVVVLEEERREEEEPPEENTLSLSKAKIELEKERI